MTNETDLKLACPECGQTEMVIKNGKQGDHQKLKCKTCNINYIDNGTDEDNTEVEVIEKSTAAKNYKVEFAIPKESKKYGFLFSSWKQYCELRAKQLPKKEKTETK